MSTIKKYAKDVFDELNKSKSKNAYQLFQKELSRLHDEQVAKSTENNVGCIISSDCSINGCYRYIVCDFPEKNTADVG